VPPFGPHRKRNTGDVRKAQRPQTFLALLLSLPPPFFDAVLFTSRYTLGGFYSAILNDWRTPPSLLLFFYPASTVIGRPPLVGLLVVISPSRPPYFFSQILLDVVVASPISPRPPQVSPPLPFQVKENLFPLQVKFFFSHSGLLLPS